MIEIRLNDQWFIRTNWNEVIPWLQSLNHGEWNFERNQTDEIYVMSFMSEEDAIMFKIKFSA